MYDANSQNTQLRLRTELAQCSYNPTMKDYISNMIMQIMNYPKKTNPTRHFIKNMNQDKIIMVWYPMSIPFNGRNYNVPLQIFIMKNVPYEPPQVFLEVVQGSAVNPANKDVNPNSRQIFTNTLRNWSQYSNIENAMTEIFRSFSTTFPIYKTSSSTPPSQNSAYGGSGSAGGGIYNVLNNAVQNAYQQNKYAPSQKSAYGPYQAPTSNIYGRSMTLEGNNNQNNNNNQPNTFGGGIYSNNNQNNNNNQPNTFGGGIYGNNNQNKSNNQPNSFGGGIYGEQKSNYVPPSSGIYGANTQNQYGNNSQYENNQYGNNQYGNNQYGNNQYGNNQYGNNQYGYNNQQQPNYNANPDEEFKNILVNEVSDKISSQLVEENKRLKTQNQRLEEYKKEFGAENDKIQNFVNRQIEIKTKCEEDMSNINKAIKSLKDYNEQNKEVSVNNENCLTFLEILDPSALKIIANETSMEELILIVRKGFERKKISFEDAISFMRNSSRDLFTIKFLKNKVIRKYNGMF